ncbi:hypothetical protein DSECCO2_386720 [anaerobic digester metagenome]
MKEIDKDQEDFSKLLSENWSLSLAVLSDSLAQGREIPVHGISVQARHQGDLGGIQIKGKELQELPEFCL